MRNHFKLTLLGLSFFVVAGCAAPVDLLITSTPPTSIAIATTETVPILTVAPSPTFTPTETPTPSPFPVIPVAQACVSNAQNQFTNHAQGVLVFYAFDENENRVIALFDPKSMFTNNLTGPGLIFTMVGVSPDREKLLYEYEYEYACFDLMCGDYRLVITDYSGKIVEDFDNGFNDDRWDYYNWVNDETLRVVKTSHDQVFPRSFNPFTKEYEQLRTDWPDSYKEKGLDWSLDNRAIKSLYYIGANIVYDPTLTRVVYPKKGQIVSLINVEAEQELASIQLPKWGRLPRWSDDGQNLVLVASANPDTTTGQDEFFIVSRDGPEFRRLTTLTEQFDTVHISDYAWSPDGKQIAFWLNTEAEDPTVEGTQSELAILDIETGEITTLCIQGISAKMTHAILITHTQPVWSPDGSQIMFAQLASNRLGYNVLVVDLTTNTAFKVTTNKEPIGWMTKEP